MLALLVAQLVARVRAVGARARRAARSASACSTEDGVGGRARSPTTAPASTARPSARRARARGRSAPWGATIDAASAGRAGLRVRAAADDDVGVGDRCNPRGGRPGASRLLVYTPAWQADSTWVTLGRAAVDGLEVVFDWTIDAGAWPGPVGLEGPATAGKAWLGPLGLLARLELSSASADLPSPRSSARSISRAGWRGWAGSGRHPSRPIRSGPRSGCSPIAMR